MVTVKRRIREFRSNESGVFAVTFALMSIVLIAFGGSAMDYTMWMSAREAAQKAADTAVLAIAIRSPETSTQAFDLAEAIIGNRLDNWPGVMLRQASYDETGRRATTVVSGTVQTYFVSLIGVQTLPVVAEAVADRATEGELELALVLDNTWSMADLDDTGSQKIATLKDASHSLLDSILRVDGLNVRVGVVPYAEYVNVGIGHRYESWMDVPEDTVTTTPRTCETRTTRQSCTKGPQQFCTRTVDGVDETYDCTKSTCEPPYTVPPYESCSGGGTRTTTWFGCVLSRTVGTLRLSDADPHTPYGGLMGTSKKCMTEILPLTGRESAVRGAIDDMVVNVGSYRPSTYIPTGLIWGVNILSPSQPFAEGNAYDDQNIRPRKVLVLMTDGDNTLRFNASNGQHVNFGNNANTANNQKNQTDTDTLAICQYAKLQGIEVFTVAFGIIEESSSKMLVSCATDPEHYFSAVSSSELNAVFKTIGDQLSSVRLVR